MSDPWKNLPNAVEKTAELGLHNDFIVVDGFQNNDPGSRTFPGYSLSCSAVEIPDPNGGFYDITDVPHGDVRIHGSFSKTPQTWRRIYVYLPPDDEKNTEAFNKKVPLLWIGGGVREERFYQASRKTLETLTGAGIQVVFSNAPSPTNGRHGDTASAIWLQDFSNK